ncbi:MAG TPA: TetR/AcrR family transcriptional regulator [Vicinamibacteria bacterium]|nr:TetR/AcrR family transcriptional regulator [Vicinamibacteria bacterium]
MQSALALFSSQGYDATSVREICEAAGITKPTLYHFYGSKEGVYRALVDGVLEDFRAHLTQRLAEGGPVVARLKRVARSYFDAARGRRELMRFIFSIIHNPPASAPVTDFIRYYDEIVQLIAGVVDEGVRDGTLAAGPTDVRMLLLMGALAEALCGWLIAGRPAELTPELADAIVDTLVRGWNP